MRRKMKKSEKQLIKNFFGGEGIYCDLAIACIEEKGGIHIFLTYLKERDDKKDDVLEQAFIFLKQSEFQRRYIG